MFLRGVGKGNRPTALSAQRKSDQNLRSQNSSDKGSGNGKRPLAGAGEGANPFSFYLDQLDGRRSDLT